ncbi:MAG TPA: S41 family peptidase [Blastocatellia bacterium]|nr:S41 family peptidase [Blastocatellia bacterium]
MIKNYFSRRRALLVALSVLLFIPQSGVVSASATGSASGAPAARQAVKAAPESLSLKDRLEVFEEVWEEIDEHYYDPSFNGVNWRAARERYRPLIEKTASDEAFYRLVKQMVGELRDAHTRFHSPRERRERERLQAVSAGVSLFEVEGKPVVLGVNPDSDAASAGVEPGMIVRTIDGKPVEQVIREALKTLSNSSSDRANRLRLYHRIIDGEEETSFKLGLSRADGSEFEVTLTRRVVSDSARVISRRLASGYGYIKLTLWKSPIHKEFKNALKQLADAPGIIIDLRGNPGGEVNQVLKIASYFFNNRVPFGRFHMRSGRVIDLHSSPDDDRVYRGSVAILVNEGSGSGSEMFAGVLQENSRAVVIGRQSCGCLLGIAKFRKVKGGGELAISELGYISPRGRKLEGAGVIPNEEVALSIRDLRDRRDAAMLEAENFLKSAVKASTGQR